MLELLERAGDRAGGGSENQRFAIQNAWKCAGQGSPDNFRRPKPRRAGAARLRQVRASTHRLWERRQKKKRPDIRARPRRRGGNGRQRLPRCEGRGKGGIDPRNAQASAAAPLVLALQASRIGREKKAPCHPSPVTEAVVFRVSKKQRSICLNFRKNEKRKVKLVNSPPPPRPAPAKLRAAARLRRRLRCVM